MKTAIYIEDGVAQLVITPETKFEKEAMQHFMYDNLECEIFEGQFYDCRGGWVKQRAPENPTFVPNLDRSRMADNRSLIVKVKNEAG